ncbi:MAG: nicotinate phosphoribosyltransferase [Deltaproteobacteria bacterium]|nr:MAG: nicotinate phosphoribosyltransferase [Deltaproteobacteria bacterium]
MTSSILATDKYKMVMAQAGAPLRPETFVLMLRRGGPFYLPVDIKTYVESLLPKLTEDDAAWLAKNGMSMDDGWRAAMNGSVEVHALPKGSWFGDREPVATVTGPSALVSWLEPQLIWLQFQIQVATLARLHDQSIATRLAVATCEEEADIIRCLLDEADEKDPGVVADPEGYAAFVHQRATAALDAVGGDPSRVMEAGMRAVSCMAQHRIALTAARDAGFRATSNVFLARELGLAPTGTTGHEHTQRWGSDYDAFTAVRDNVPGPVTFLLDTYSTRMSGLPVALSVMKETPERMFSMRFDSESTMRGDYLLGVHMLAEQGVEAAINLGGGFDAEITRDFEGLAEFTNFPKARQKYMYGQYLVRPHVPLPTRGSVGAVYKLAQTGRRPTMKFSDNLEKSSIPGHPVVFRLRAPEGAELGAKPLTVVGQRGERPPQGYFQLTDADRDAVFFDRLSPSLVKRFRAPGAVALSAATQCLVDELDAERRRHVHY